MGQNKNYQVVFKITAVFIPIIALIILELCLRIFNYGFNTQVFLEDKSQPENYVTNTQISRLFFSNKKDARTGIKQSFRKKKQPGTFRIFVIGESSAYGYPYTPRASFARMLDDRLLHTCRDRKIEVINLSVTALNSYAFLAFSREIIEMEPDAVIIYAGHNEYYGAMGVGSSQHLRSNRQIKKAVIYLKRFRVVQLCFSASEFLKSLFARNHLQEASGFMFRMSNEQQIVYGSDIYETGIEQFTTNMDKLLFMFNESNIPVFFSTLVSNEKDQKPFISSLKNTSDSSAYFEIFRKAKEALLEEDYKSFDIFFSACSEIDSTYAMNNYMKGEVCYALGDYNQAIRYYSNSKEFDALRFRAPEAINQEIRLLSRKYQNVHLVDAIHNFRQRSKQGILDSNLFMDHLHPNLYGNFILADAFYNSILESELLGDRVDTISFEQAWNELPVTDIDSVYGLFMNLTMKEQWPFYEHTAYVPDLNDYPVRLTMMIFNNKISYSSALDSLFYHYLKGRNIEEAIRVARSVGLEHAYDTKLLDRIAHLYLQVENYNQSVFYYQKAFELKPDVETSRKIVLCLLQIDQPEKALKYLVFLREKDPNDRMSADLMSKVGEAIELKIQIVTEPGNIHILNKLSAYYLFTGNLQAAKMYIDRALVIDAGNRTSREYLNIYEKAKIQIR